MLKDDPRGPLRHLDPIDWKDEANAEAAVRDLREAGLEPEQPTFDDPFFDSVAQVPEARGLVVGTFGGGLLSLALFQTINVGMVWIPHLSPLMSAGEYADAVPVWGLGLGVVFGVLVGGVVGTLRPMSKPGESAIAVEAPDDRIEEAAEMLRGHDAIVVGGRVTYLENPGGTPREGT